MFSATAVYLLRWGSEKAGCAGVLGEQLRDPHAQPPPGAALEQARLAEVDPVHLVQVGLDERPLVEQVTPGRA
jgi:hypothetical protein